MAKDELWKNIQLDMQSLARREAELILRKKDVRKAAAAVASLQSPLVMPLSLLQSLDLFTVT